MPIIAPAGNSSSSSLLTSGVNGTVGVDVTDAVGGRVVNILDGVTSVITVINEVAT